MKHAQSYVTVPLLQRFIFCWFHASFLVTTNCKRLKANSIWAAPTLSPAARLLLPKTSFQSSPIIVNNSIQHFSLFHLCLPVQHSYICSWTCYLPSLQYLLFSQFIHFVIPPSFCNADVVYARLPLHFHSIFYTGLRNSRHFANLFCLNVTSPSSFPFPFVCLVQQNNNKMLVTFSNSPSLFVAFPCFWRGNGSFERNWRFRSVLLVFCFTLCRNDNFVWPTILSVCQTRYSAQFYSDQ